MSLKAFLATLSVSSILAWVGWFIVIENIDPFSNPDLAFLFFVTLALALIGTITTIGLAIRRLIIKDDDALLRHLKQSFRQALLVTLAVLTTLLLGQKGLFAWWIGIILIAIIAMVEAIAYSSRTARSGYVQ